MNFGEWYDKWADQQGNTGNATDPQASARAGWDAGRYNMQLEMDKAKDGSKEKLDNT